LNTTVLKRSTTKILFHFFFFIIIVAAFIEKNKKIEIGMQLNKIITTKILNNKVFSSRNAATWPLRGFLSSRKTGDMCTNNKTWSCSFFTSENHIWVWRNTRCRIHVNLISSMQFYFLKIFKIVKKFPL